VEPPILALALFSQGPENAPNFHQTAYTIATPREWARAVYLKYMKAVILAGGLGTRLSEETHLKPKPMIEIGGKPILWHIMKLYSGHGVNEFVICCGYKGYVIKEYFANYFLHMSDVTFDMERNAMNVHHRKAEPWKVTLVDTGDNTLTGGRLKRVAPYVKDEQEFCFTYGDGLTDLDIGAEIAYHRQHGKWATVTAVRPPGRYGALQLRNKAVAGLLEKPPGDGGVINGGFFVLSPKCLDLIDGDETSWESGPLSTLAERDQLLAWEHHGFWQPMDTLRDKNHLEELWESGAPPWKNW
jgi:glucose-1-phosphate cytidylyltransferase